MRARTIISLAQIARRESYEVSRTRRLIGPAWTTAEQLVRCINATADHVSAGAAGAPTLALSKSIAAALFLRAAARTTAFEFLEIARRHWPESILKRRRAHELLAFAWIALRDRQAADRWIAQRDNWDRYLRSFDNKAVPAALEQLSPGEAANHRKLQRIAHPSIASLAPSLRIRSHSPVYVAAVDLFDDQRHAAAGLVQIVKAERILDSTRQTHAILRGFVRRCCRMKPWDSRRRHMAEAIDNVEWRIDQDARHYQGALVMLHEYRATNNAKVRARFKMDTAAHKDRRARVTSFFEEGTGDEPDFS